MIRAAVEADSNAIWEIVNASVESGVELARRPGTPRDQVPSAWLGPGLHTDIAEGDGEVVGAYVLGANQPGLGSHVANGSYAVARRRRGEGIGRGLGTDSIERARALRFRALQFNLVVASNEGALRLWSGLGFEWVGSLPGAFELSDGTHAEALVMFRRLDAKQPIATREHV
jgi:L-amino acid N-acyltransferase YncA